MMVCTITSYHLLQLFVVSLLTSCVTVHARVTARELKPQFVANIRRLQESGGSELSPLAEDTYNHLIELCLDAEGEPNPRHPCTPEHDYAAKYVEEQMKELGLVPVGNTERTSFVQLLAGSVDETMCPTGIKNIIGMVPGSSFPEEYIVYAAHYDGPHNENPQTDVTRNIGETSNAYDDGLAVALGLAMAKDLINNPPLRSVVFLFDDAEEGWPSVRARKEGDTAADHCNRLTKTEWYKRTFEAAGGFDIEGSDIDSCQSSVIGSSYWTKNPTIEFGSIKMMFVVDMIGSPYGSDSQYLHAWQGEQTTYNSGTDGTTLNDFLDEVWPTDSTVQLIKAPRVAVEEGGSSIDPVQKNYRAMCGDACLASGGLPAIWLIQPAFQKYHGGVNIYIVKWIFGELFGNGTLPSTAYFSEDKLASFYLPNLDAMASAIHELVNATANNEQVLNLAFNAEKGGTLETADMKNAVVLLNALLTESQKLPEGVAQTIGAVAATLLEHAQGLSMANLTDPTNQEGALQVAGGALGLFMSLDFFNPDYPTGEAFLDQTYSYPVTLVEDEPFPTQPSSEPSSVACPRLFAGIVTLFAGAVALIISV